jgi:type IV pilus assembly protein PilV
MLNTMKPTQKAIQSGVSLLEVLVAILIVSFGVLGLVGLQARATQFSLGAEDRNRAALLADEVSAQMVMSNTNSLSSAQIAEFQEQAASALPNGSLSITTAGRQSRIVVTWRQPSAGASSPFNAHFTDVVIP